MSTRLLIATVGGSIEPLVASLLQWRPARVIFIASPETRSKVNAEIVPEVQKNGWAEFDTGRCDIEEIADAQDYASLVARIGRLEKNVRCWRANSSDSQIIADVTGGTKPMSCALALAAARWPGCKIAYVGGTERGKDGVGVVITGREQIVEAPNPWESLGLPVLDLALSLLRERASSAAAALLQASLSKLDDAARKAEFSALLNFANALTDWERFEHRSALNKLNDLAKSANNLEAVLGYDFTPTLTKAKAHLSSIVDSPTGVASMTLTLDLLANATRRIREGRYDDAVARLYRAIEALAQSKLHGHGFTDTSKVPLDKVPEPLRSEWQARAADGLLKLGLQDDYALLTALGDEVGTRFTGLKLDDPQRSPLVARNSSILAHGYAPVSKDTAEKLHAAALHLAGLTESDLTFFPTLKH